MGQEIERKFLVRGDAWRTLGQGVQYRQGYLNSDKDRTVRIRTMGEKAVITVKGINRGAVRTEFEYEIPKADCDAMLDTLAERPLIEKTRYSIHLGGLKWEVDEFHGENAGLVIVELELQREDQPFEKPEWVGEDVTGDPRYYNSNLAKHPQPRK